jgi:hypothetical protein
MRDQDTVPRSIHFDIQRITLPGYSPSQRERFIGALETRLTELSASGNVAWPAAGQRVGHLDAGLLRPSVQPEEAAQRIAARLLAAIGHRAGEHDN